MDECQNVIDFHNFDVIDDATEYSNMGQSESKKASKRATGVETKGTAMSFGFKKKLLTPNKKAANGGSKQEKERETQKDKLTQDQQFHNSATVISNPGIDKTDNACSDDNGNRGSMDSLNEKDVGRTTPRLTPPKKEQMGGPYRSIRFGFRQGNTVRPASVGLHPKVTNYDNVSNNNVIEKPRSKSASSTYRTALNRSPNMQQQYQGNNRQQIYQQQQQQHNSKRDNPKIAPVSTTVKISYQQQAKQKFGADITQVNDCANKPPTGKQHQSHQYHPQSQQYAVINTGMHTNEIVRPVPQPATLVTKFTLHTTSLPKPQYPVPISLTSAVRQPMDTKFAKQAVNTSRRGFQGPRDISTDSGISSIDNNCMGYDHQGIKSSPRRTRSRPRNLEMVFSGPHKFEVRDLDDSLSDESIVPLSLPKLPNVFNSESSQPAPLSGLIRTEYQPRELESPTEGINLDFRKNSLTSLDVDSIEEEKVFRDNSTTEKEIRNILIKEYSPSSKTSSPASSRASWCNAGESMAIKDCSSISVSSTDSVNRDNKMILCENLQDEDLSLVTLTLDNKSTFTSTTTSLPLVSHPAPNIKSKQNLNEVLTIDVDTVKFAQLTAVAGDTLLDDETSPTVSLVSTDSDEIISKKNKKKINDSIKEKNIEDMSPLLEATSPLSPGTPTHASNSLSLSDGGRDFFDDEIADQPALCFADSHDIAASTPQLHSLTDTPTLIESHMSPKSRSRKSFCQTPININNSYAPQAKPRQSLLSRTESLDTLSPCESIASDDLMMDFECHSSLDSIDRMSHSNHSGSGSALHSMDETQLWSELEAKGGAVLKEWSSLLRSSRNNSISQDKLISQLPARSTRLLNRSRLNQTPVNHPGSDSPRSLDSFHNRKTPPSRAGSQISGGRSDDDSTFIFDKSLRNSMIQDVLSLKKQLIRLRSVLQEPDEECLTRTDTLNPFEISNGQFFGTGGFDSKMFMENKDLYNYASSQDETRQELIDLRRQVVYLQSQIDDKDRTIRIQQSLIEKLQLEIDKPNKSDSESHSIHQIDTTNTATQTERTRPLSIGQEGLLSGTKAPNESASLNNNTKHLTSSPLRKSNPNASLANGHSVTSISSSTTISTAATTITTTTTITDSDTKCDSSIKAPRTVRSINVSNVKPCLVTLRNSGFFEKCSNMRTTGLPLKTNNITKPSVPADKPNSKDLPPPRRIPRLYKVEQNIEMVNEISIENGISNKMNGISHDGTNENYNRTKRCNDSDLIEKTASLNLACLGISVDLSKSNSNNGHNSHQSAVRVKNNLNVLKSTNFA